MGTHTAHGTERIPHRGTTSALALHASASSSHALTTLEQRLDSALVGAAEQERPVRPRQLSWNGVRVSEELQRYATCVARGQALAPYRGPVLARSQSVFPWNLEATPLHAQQPRRVDPPWTVWQLAVFCLLFTGVVLGGGASLLADSDGAELPLWTTAMLEPRVNEPPRAATAAPEASPVREATAPRSLAARKSRPAGTVSASVGVRSRSTTRAATRSQPSNVASNAASSAEENALFVEAPSF